MQSEIVYAWPGAAIEKDIQQGDTDAMNTFERVAANMLAREGIGIIWDLHLRAAASYRRGNWLSAMALAGLADVAEQLCRRGA